MPSIPALVDPAMLVWARTTANLEPKAAARKIGLPDDRVEEWEQGSIRPTVAQLRKAAAVYRRSLAVFFLPEPPAGFETLRDFRRVATSSVGVWSTALHAEYRRAHVQRDALLDIAELDEESPSTAWRSPRAFSDDAALAAWAAGMLHQHAVARRPPPSADAYAHLNYWTNAMEESGILVMTTSGGDVQVGEMRAFSLYFDELPVVMLNGTDSPRGRLFSLVHELVHLLLHTEGLCDTTTDTVLRSPDRQLEARCNAVAAEILMPAPELLSSTVVAEHAPGTSWSLTELLEGAKPHGVSVEAFLRRLVTLRLATLAEYRLFRDSQSAAVITRESSGGNFYYTKARDLGKGYVRRVADAHRRTLIDSVTAATYLDVKVEQIPRLAKVAQV
ncbi:MAG: ImmA/IrrE family metallo-endopeptidase [Dermatophilaceae bacterium]|nr:ImmA/IrrE family metallo-endopeptidase [Dermatophilaceae bacterium]